MPGPASANLTVAAVGANRPCGFARSSVAYEHVMWVFMENESLSSIIGAPDAPFATLLARRCGLAGDYYAIGHPSLPNYLADHRWHDSRGERRRRAHGPPGFRPVDLLRGRCPPPTWRWTAESMPVACDTVTSGSYAARHNPAVYYTALRKACARDDVAMGPIEGGALHEALYSDKLANFVFVTPNICDDAHSCPVLHGDQWLARFMSMVFASTTYPARSHGRLRGLGRRKPHRTRCPPSWPLPRCRAVPARR